MPPRTTSQRISDTKRRLESDPDVWLATASSSGMPHLVPLSLGWDGARLTLYTYSNSVTRRNVEATGQARAALDGTVDVVILDGVASIEALDDVEPGRVDLFVERAGWDPRRLGSEFSLITLSPWRIDAWNSVEELEGRTIMRHGQWLAS